MSLQLHGISSSILESECRLLPIKFTGWQMFHNDNGDSELSLGWNSTDLANLLLKGKFVNSNEVEDTSSLGSVLISISYSILYSLCGMQRSSGLCFITR